MLGCLLVTCQIGTSLLHYSSSLFHLFSTHLILLLVFSLLLDLGIEFLELIVQVLLVGRLFVEFLELLVSLLCLLLSQEVSLSLQASSSLLNRLLLGHGRLLGGKSGLSLLSALFCKLSHRLARVLVNLGQRFLRREFSKAVQLTLHLFQVVRINLESAFAAAD